MTVTTGLAGAPSLPRSVRLASWGTAVLAGRVSPDTAAERVVGSDGAHRVAGLPGLEEPVSLPLALARLRSRGVSGLRLALPAPGDPAGLPGPAELNHLAVEAGEAVLTVGDPWLGLVPSLEVGTAPGARVLWRAHPAGCSPGAGLPTLSEADRALRTALAEATEELTRMDVARGRAAAQPVLARLLDDRALEGALAPGCPARAVGVLALARRVAGIVALAAEAPGGAVSAQEMARRTAVLRDLARTARHAQAAACNAVLEPQPPVAGAAPSGGPGAREG